MKKILGYGGYAGERLAMLARNHLKADLAVVTQGDEANFRIIPKQWTVVRSIAWFT